MGGSLHGQFPFFRRAEVFDAVRWDSDEGQLAFDSVQLGVVQGLLVGAVVV